MNLKLIAHKTASKFYPPNSIESVLFLVKHGISSVEFDVCSTREGKLVVAHPGFLNDEMLETADLFVDFLKVCGSRDVEVFIDVKFTDFRFDVPFLDSVRERIFEVGMEERSVIISRSEKTLLRFKGIIETGYITPEFNSRLDYPWGMLLLPITNVQKNIHHLECLKWKLVATDVDISNFRFTQNLSLYAIMTDYAIDIQALMREREW